MNFVAAKDSIQNVHNFPFICRQEIQKWELFRDFGLKINGLHKFPKMAHFLISNRDQVMLYFGTICRTRT